MPDEIRERAALLALLRRADRGWPDIAREVLDRGSAADLLDHAVAGMDSLFPQPDRTDELIAEAATQLHEWRAAGLGVHTVLDTSYPQQLREIREVPPVVFTRGQLAEDTRAIAVVGTRNASERGLAFAADISTELSHRQITVVSGLAAGIDTAAHRATLEAGGRTVAVIGTGIQRQYPSTNRALQERIATEGLLLSQFWPDAPPRKPQFLMRNAVMSGYAAATLVVEAGEQSGARNQARLAVEHGRPVVLLRGLLVHEWAQKLAQRPGVTVAGDPDEVLSAVKQILEQRTAELSPWEATPDLAIT